MSGLSRLRPASDDAGFTLIELLVVMMLMGIFGSIFMASVLGADRSATATAAQHDLNEEARLALNRMARELREATGLTTVLNPDGPSYDTTAITAVTFTADFNGDGCIDGAAPTPMPNPAPSCQPYAASNRETLTYCWDPSASVRQLYLIPGALAAQSCQVSGALPILAGQVTSFKLSYRSNEYLYDADGNGISTWLELDQAGPPVGNSDGQLNPPEVGKVDSIVVDVSVAAGTHTQSYTTQVDLRNLS